MKLLKIISFVLLMHVTRVSSILPLFQPAKYTQERYERTRNRTISKSINSFPDNLETLAFTGIVNRYGYPAEEYIVTTDDGYRLRVHRIPGSPASPKAKGKPIIFFQHGILVSSDSWVLVGPKNDFAYTLADAGYDVWFGNVRGNTYSRSHIRLSPDNDPEFWKFSYHEIALYDIPATIDFILRETNQKQLIYLGHSMGATVSYVLLSTRPEYNQKIKLVISLAPAAFWYEPISYIAAILKRNYEFLKELITDGHINELLPLTEVTPVLAKMSCSKTSIFQQFCLNFFYNFYAPDQNETMLPYMLAYFPAGTSGQTMLHFLQNIKTGDFRMFDHGTVQNLAKYGQKEPPSYNLNNVIAPVVIFYAKGDSINSPSNIFQLSSRLPNLLSVEAIADDMFNHADFWFSKDIKLYVNDPLMDVINKTLL